MLQTKDSYASVKSAATQLVRELPESASWDDLMYEILVRQKIDNGMADIEAGRTHTHASIRKEFGLA
ncbi:MAG: hypothetical protein IZT59_02050 [Verrucomicrobia bacterium]|jgi:predicted transcriptional regulator|nr:hypothetical protein [Verrucomicrobiota bacterium]|tara:strand:+ start:49056 stop:49256 length:201 start_codon:yes stop_codon:yes gene_type:complete